MTKNDIDINDQFQRISLIKEVIEYYFNKYKHIMINPHTRLYFEMSDTDKNLAITAMHGHYFILVKLGVLDQVIGSIVTSIEQSSNRILPDYEIEYIIICEAAFTILHEIHHGAQFLLGAIMYNQNYINMIEDSVNYETIKIMKEEGYGDNILSLIIGTQYKRGFMHTEPCVCSYYEYYYAAMTQNMSFTTFEQSNALSYILQELPSIKLVNNVNGMNEETYIKIDDEFLQPSEAFTKLIEITSKLCLDDRSILNILTEFNEDTGDIIIIFTGNIYINPLINNVDLLYGVAPIYLDKEY